MALSWRGVYPNAAMEVLPALFCEFFSMVCVMEKLDTVCLCESRLDLILTRVFPYVLLQAMRKFANYFTPVPWRGGHMAAAMVGIGYYFRCCWSEPAPESNLTPMHLMIVPSFILWHGHLSTILYLRFGEVAIWSQPWRSSDITSDVMEKPDTAEKESKPYLGEVAIWSQPWRASDTTSDVASLSLFIKPLDRERYFIVIHIVSAATTQLMEKPHTAESNYKGSKAT
ncbi:hypothetical protein Tco_0441877 [Tanacetum coccineum]